MSELATLDQLGEAAGAIRFYVDEHDSHPRSSSSASFLACYAALRTPRIIGGRTANFLRLFKGLTGDALAGALYNEAGLEAYPDSEQFPEAPVRSVIIKADLLSSTCAFDGAMFDGLGRPVTSDTANELLADVSTAYPVVPSRMENS